MYNLVCCCYDFTKWKVCQFCKKVYYVERGNSLHMYHPTLECFQKLIDISKLSQLLSIMYDKNRIPPCSSRNTNQLIKIG